jgi:MFS family permease
MLGLGMFVWSVAQLFGGLVTNLHQFLAARIALGIGEAPQFPAGAKVVSEWFAQRERGKPTGIFVTSSTIGPALAPPILTVLLLNFGWRNMFVIMGALGIAVSIGWYIVYRNRRDVKLEAHELAHLTEGEPAQRAERNMTFAEWRGLFGKATTWGMIFGFMGVIYMVWLYLTWLPAYLEHERGLSIANTGWVVSIPYFFGTIGMVSSGFIADRLLRHGFSPIGSRKWPICTGLIGAALFTVPAALTGSTVMAVVYISLAMLFINLASGGAWSLVSVAAPRHVVASLGSIQNFGGFLAGSAAPLITGIVVDRTHSFVNALIVSAAVACVSAMSYLFIVKSPIAASDDTLSDPLFDAATTKAP